MLVIANVGRFLLGIQKRCPTCEVVVTPALDGSCTDCGTELDEVPETVDLEAEGLASCPSCGGYVFVKSATCPPCGASLPKDLAPGSVLPVEPPVEAPTEGDAAAGSAGASLEIARARHTRTDWERKWQRAEMEAMRERRGSGRLRMYLLSLVVVVLAGGAIAVQSIGALDTTTIEGTAVEAALAKR